MKTTTLGSKKLMRMVASIILKNVYSYPHHLNWIDFLPKTGGFPSKNVWNMIINLIKQKVSGS